MTKGKLNLFLWILQGLLCVMFLMSGLMKLFVPIADLTSKLPWVAATTPFLVRLLGVIDLLGAFGIILPMALKKWPLLTLWAAAGISGLMICAIIFHISRGEAALIGINILLLLMALAVL